CLKMGKEGESKESLEDNPSSAAS
ncbi:hypothetical protein CEXT_804601, partial [Caerostris extrusa]